MTRSRQDGQLSLIRRPEPPNPEPMATENQQKYLADLVLDRRVPENWLVKMAQEQQTDKLTKERASLWISRLRGLKRKTPEHLVLPDVKPGWYALPGKDKLKFYRVRIAKKGNWKGQLFLDAQGGPEYYPIYNKEQKAAILWSIARDPEAGLRYAREVGRCYSCNLELTDEISRRVGQGPICRNK